MIVSGCEISHNGWGSISCFHSSNIAVSGCRISHDRYGNGIGCFHSSNIAVSGCEISYNGWHGIYCEGSSDIAVHYCNIISNAEHGLYNNGTYVVNATYNWWGSPGGPEYKEEGDPEDPEEVYSYYGPEYLIYEPWLTEPAIIIIYPIIIISGITIKKDVVTIEWVVEHGTYDIAKVEIRLDSGPWIDVTGMTNYTFTGLPEGKHIVTIRAIDEVGNVAEDIIKFYVELPRPAPPTVYLIAAAIVLIAVIAIAAIARKRKD